MSDDIDIAMGLLDKQNAIMAKIQLEEDHDIIREYLDELCEIMKDSIIISHEIHKDMFDER